ncbi:MAG: alpha/beta hydrolase [Clostridia bacterium]|nr:alpha/beta hydrolase [Clostridia bacterium]
MEFWYRLFGVMWKITEKADERTRSRQTLPPGITVVRGIPYGGDGDPYHLCNAYYPEENDGKLPVIIDVHGGGWMYGDRDSSVLYDSFLASRGFLVFSMSYRLVPEVTARDQLCDVNSALCAIREKMKDLPCDPEKIMLTGDSAGGMLAIYTAALARSPFLRERFGLEDPGLSYSCVTLTSPVAYMNDRSLMGSYGRLMWRERPFRKARKSYMNANELLPHAGELPPMLLITSAGDVVARTQTMKLYRDLRGNGRNAELLYYGKPEGARLPHVFAVQKPDSPMGRDCLDRICAFFRAHIPE